VSLGQETIIEGLNLEVDFPSIIAFTGNNGSGKSTFFNALRKKIDCKGRVTINGRETKAQDFSYLGQSYSFSFPFLVSDFIRINASLDYGDEMYHQILDTLEIHDLLNKSINQISQGQLQKCLIAQTLMQKSEIILLDEPESFLDIKSKKQFCKLLKEYTNQIKKIGLIISHDQNIVAQIADKEITFGL